MAAHPPLSCPRRWVLVFCSILSVMQLEDGISFVFGCRYLDVLCDCIAFVFGYRRLPSLVPLFWVASSCGMHSTVAHSGMASAGEVFVPEAQWRATSASGQHDNLVQRVEGACAAGRRDSSG